MGPVTSLLRLTQAIGNIAWKTIGNPGSGLVLGTTTLNGFDFITNNIPRGGFTADGFFFSSDQNANPVIFFLSRSVSTVDATPTTIHTGDFFGFAAMSYFEFNITAFRTNGVGQAAFKRAVIITSDGLASTVWNPLTTLFTDKQNTATNYDVQVVALAPTQFEVQVIGDVGHDVNWAIYLADQRVL